MSRPAVILYMNMADRIALSREVLLEYGFSINNRMSDLRREVMTKDWLDIVIEDGNCYYSNLGINYPLKDLAGLMKFYKEVTSRELISAQDYTMSLSEASSRPLSFSSSRSS